MNRPPLPTRKTAMCSHRPEQNLTRLAPGSGAVRLPVLSESQRGMWLARRNSHNDREVKNVRSSFCTFVFTKLCTLARSTGRKAGQLKTSASESDSEKSTKTGGSDPTFDGLQPPKPKWGRSRPSRRKRDRVLAACRNRRMQDAMQDVRQGQ
jgi:hypothetical protein